MSDTPGLEDEAGDIGVLAHCGVAGRECRHDVDLVERDAGNSWWAPRIPGGGRQAIAVGYEVGAQCLGRVGQAGLFDRPLVGYTRLLGGRRRTGGGRPGKVKFAFDRRRRIPWQLGVARSLHHQEPDLVEHLEDAEAGPFHRLRQRLGKGAVAVGAVLGHIAGLGRKRYECALGRLHLGETAAGRAQAAAAEWIVAAGVKDHEVELGARARHLTQHQLAVEHLEVHVGFARRFGVDRREVIRAPHLHGVTGIIKQPDIGAEQQVAEVLHRAVDTGFVEIELGTVADQREAERAQRFRHQRRIVLRIVEPPHRFVGGIADDQRHTLLGVCRYGQRQAGRENDRRSNDLRDEAGARVHCTPKRSMAPLPDYATLEWPQSENK